MEDRVPHKDTRAGSLMVVEDLGGGTRRSSTSSIGLKKLLSGE